MKRFSIVGLCIALLLSPLFLFAAAPSADYPYPNSAYTQPYDINLAPGDSIPSITAPAPFVNPALSFPWIQILPADATITPALPGISLVAQDRIPNAPITFTGTIPNNASGIYTISIPARNINDYCTNLTHCDPLPPNSNFPFIIKLQVGPLQPPTVKPITTTPATIDLNYNFKLTPFLANASTVSLDDQGIMTFNDFGLGLLNNGNNSTFQGVPTANASTINNLILTASNAAGSASSDPFSLTIWATAKTPVTVNTISNPAATVDSNYFFALQDPNATNSPIFNASNINFAPSDLAALNQDGLRFAQDFQNGNIWAFKGVPTQAATLSLPFTATNTAGKPGSGTITLNIAAGNASPSINTIPALSATVDKTFYQEIAPLYAQNATLINANTSLGALAANGLTLRYNETGGWNIEGTPTQPVNNLPITIAATNVGNSTPVTSTFNINIASNPSDAAPVVDATMPTPPVASLNTSYFWSFAPAHVRNASEIKLTPASLQILKEHGLYFGNSRYNNNGTCLLSQGPCILTGTPTGATLTAQPISFTAANQAGLSTGQFVLTIQSGSNTSAPTITNLANQTAFVGQQLEPAIVLSDSSPTSPVRNATSITLNSASKTALTNIGLNFGDANGMCLTANGTCAITGTPNATLPATAITFTASNGNGTSAPSSFNLTVNQGASIPNPSINMPAIIDPAYVGSSYSYNLAGNSRVINFTNITITKTIQDELAAQNLILAKNAQGQWLISGTPTSPTTLSGLQFIATNVDSSHSTTSSTFSLVINPALPTPTAASVLLRAYENDSNKLLSVASNFNPTASTYTLQDGTLPNGLSFETTTGVFTGAPNTGTASWTPYVMHIVGNNNAGLSGTPLQVNMAVGTRINAPSANVGDSANIPLQFAQNLTPATCTVDSLPHGLHLSTDCKTITGTYEDDQKPYPQYYQSYVIGTLNEQTSVAEINFSVTNTVPTPNGGTPVVQTWVQNTPVIADDLSKYFTPAPSALGCAVIGNNPLPTGVSLVPDGCKLVGSYTTTPPTMGNGHYTVSIIGGNTKWGTAPVTLTFNYTPQTTELPACPTKSNDLGNMSLTDTLGNTHQFSLNSGTIYSGFTLYAETINNSARLTCAYHNPNDATQSFAIGTTLPTSNPLPSFVNGSPYNCDATKTNCSVQWNTVQ